MQKFIAVCKAKDKKGKLISCWAWTKNRARAKADCEEKLAKGEHLVACWVCDWSKNPSVYELIFGDVKESLPETDFARLLRNGEIRGSTNRQQRAALAKKITDNIVNKTEAPKLPSKKVPTYIPYTVYYAP